MFSWRFPSLCLGGHQSAAHEPCHKNSFLIRGHRYMHHCRDVPSTPSPCWILDHCGFWVLSSTGAPSVQHLCTPQQLVYISAHPPTQNACRYVSPEFRKHRSLISSSSRTVPRAQRQATGQAPQKAQKRGGALSVAAWMMPPRVQRDLPLLPAPQPRRRPGSRRRATPRAG